MSKRKTMSTTGTRSRARRQKQKMMMALCSLGFAAFGAHGQVVKSTPLARSGTNPAATVIDARWRENFEAFDAADKLHAPEPGGVLFVGSSSIRLWDDLENDFQSVPLVLKRGFGGSRLADCTQYVDRLVLRYKPRLVIVYAGDNDLAEGASPQEVLESFRGFVSGVHAALPETRIAYVSIKPSPLRVALMKKALDTNTLIEAYSRTQPKLDYIDIYSKMLDADGQPRRDLFREDALHLNAAGYAIWRDVISAHLR